MTLVEVVAANIVRSQFFHNTVIDCSISTTGAHLSNDGAFDFVLDFCYQTKPGGVLYTVSSNVSIVSSSFTHNRADIGGALVAYNSALHIYESAYVNNTANFGGAMVSSRSTISTVKSIFTHNSAQDSGGVMMTFNDRLSISGTAFTKNTANNFAGVMITLGNSSIAIDNSYFTSNGATEGGVIRAFNDSSFVIDNSTFVSNTASKFGGVIVTSNNSSFSTSNSNFTSNSATMYGGVIVTDGHSSLTINNSTFTSNSAKLNGGVMTTSDNTMCIVNNSNFTSNRATYGGIMRTSYKSSFMINNCNFIFNRATYGGVMRTSNKASFTIRNSNFTSNRASRYGGVLRLGGFSTFTTSNCNFVFNHANERGGVIMTSENSSVTISQCTFASNRAEEGGVMRASDYSLFTICSSSFALNNAYEGGVMKTHDNSLFTISNSVCTSNSADRFGGVIRANGHSSFVIYNSNFTYNSANYGGVMRTLDGSSFTISSSNFSFNSAYYNGGTMATSQYSSFNISDSSFSFNNANYGGVAKTQDYSRVTMSRCIFTSNRADYGGVIMMYDNSFSIVSDSNFNFNSADYGGVMYTRDDCLSKISSSNFSFNIADHGGIIVVYGDSSIIINNNNFVSNRAIYGGVMLTGFHASSTIRESNFTSNTAYIGGVIQSYHASTFYISHSCFTSNNADYGGVMETYSDSSFIINNSSFTSNSAEHGGVMVTYSDSSFTIRNSTFISNSADYGGVMETYRYSTFKISKSTFNNNRAEKGGVLRMYNYSSFTISNSTFLFNDAAKGGVMRTHNDSLLTISNSKFIDNSATSKRIVHCSDGSLNIENSHFNSNAVDNYGGEVIFITQCSTHIVQSTFDHIVGSIYTFNSNLTFSGNSIFENNAKLCLAGIESACRDGGVITSLRSTVKFNNGSTTLFSNCRTRDGGAILAIESTIKMWGETTIDNHNMITIANSSGGGISLKYSHLQIFGKCNIVNNSAVRGGGIHATSSTIVVYQSGTLHLINNNAVLGGGMYLEVNSKVHVLKMIRSLETPRIYPLSITGNSANYGGAVYVADNTNLGGCSPDNECFIQTLALYNQDNDEHLTNIDNVIFFLNNTATQQGSNLFGGQLNRCHPSQSAEVYLKKRINYSGLIYLQNISNIDLDSISSKPVRVCFCNSEHEPDCSHQNRTIRIKKGEVFEVSVVAVDQANNAIQTNITSSLSSTDSSFGEGQQSQSIERNCTDLSYNVFSPHDSEVIDLFVNRECGGGTHSTSHVTIQFADCTCPAGFEPLYSQTETRCECTCDSKLYPFIADCNYASSSVFRLGTNSWITYVNDTDPPGYIKYPNCHFDYCKPLTENISINFNVPNGEDAQCAYTRTGVLCGACGRNSSLSLASSRCLPCHSHWPAVCIVIILTSIVAGILLVTVLLALNMTVSIGLINGFIFYANIVSAGSAVFFPSSEPSFPSIFVAWLNLDIGIDVCFIDGLDMYIKTWLQLAFPTYIIFLVVMVIILSEYSPRFARLIGKRDPVSTLATLILLSYAKLLSVTITVLSFAVLDYPDGKQEIVWLPDGNVKYFQGKHIPLALVALFIIIIGLPYTILLFLWQWIVRAPSWKIFTWTRNTKLNAFITTYHVPQSNNYRYWTGLLLLVRVVLYVTASVTVSTNVETLPLITGVLIGFLLCVKGVFGIKTYKNVLVNTVDTAHYFNLLLLVLFSQYDFKRNTTKQTAVTYMSVIITLILFIVSLCYHIALLIKKRKAPQDLNEYPLTPVQQASAEVTFSVIELPQRGKGPSPDKDRDVAVF